MPGNNDWAVWRYNADGSPDADFGTNGIVITEFFGNADEALGIALYQDKIIVAGKTRNATDYLDFAVARYENDFNVSVPASKEAVKLTVMPNPVKKNGTVRLNYNLTEAGNVTIEIVNVTGVTVFRCQMGTQAAGTQSAEIKIPSNIRSGVYFVRISGSKQAFSSTRLIISE
jgi:hypothetical protein